MTDRDRMTHEEIEQIIAGRISHADPQLGRLARALDYLRTGYVLGPRTEVRSAHLEAMAAAFGSASPAQTSRTRQRRFGVGSRVAGLAAGLVLFAGSALAATGALPDAAQNAVADAVHPVGLDLPGGNEDTPKEAPAKAEEGKAKAAANRAEAKAFTDAKKEWTDCVAREAPAHEGSGPFDPEAACGEKPRRSPNPGHAGGQPGGDEADIPDDDGDAPGDRPGNGPVDEPGERGNSQGSTNGSPPVPPGPPDHAGGGSNHGPGS
jgi:hypothetical protein